jgi:hypothetical protein
MVRCRNEVGLMPQQQVGEDTAVIGRQSHCFASSMITQECGSGKDADRVLWDWHHATMMNKTFMIPQECEWEGCHGAWRQNKSVVALVVVGD